MTINHQILLDNRPQGEATVSNFKLVEAPIPALQDGQVLVRHHYTVSYTHLTLPTKRIV